MILEVVAMAGFLSIRFVYMWTNRWRRQKIASWTAEQIAEFEAGISRLEQSTLRRGDQKYTYIYGY